MRVDRPFVRQARVYRRYSGHRQDHTCQSARKIAGCRFKCIQFTPDLVPADVVGVNIYNSVGRGFEFREGPIFNEIVLADEINCASPERIPPFWKRWASGKSPSTAKHRSCPNRFCPRDTQSHRNGRCLPVAESIAKPLPPTIFYRLSECRG